MRDDFILNYFYFQVLLQNETNLLTKQHVFFQSLKNLEAQTRNEKCWLIVAFPDYRYRVKGQWKLERGDTAEQASMSLGSRNQGLYSPEPPPPPQTMATRWGLGLSILKLIVSKTFYGVDFDNLYDTDLLLVYF